MSVFSPIEKSFWLQRICEANYDKLADLVPNLAAIDDSATARAGNKPALHLRLLERSPYTLTLELTHDFIHGVESLLEPAVIIRVCLDSRTAEVLGDHYRPFVARALRGKSSTVAVLDYKWTLNYFLARWLDHCLSNQYRFAYVPGCG